MITALKKITLAISLILTSSAVLASDLHWTYDEQEEWGDITDKSVTSKPPYPYADCNLGQKQSPVDLGAPQLVTGTNLLQPKYVQESLSLSNNGHTLKVNLTKSSLAIGNEKYSLLQYHIHAPSEHVINGKTYPLEIHFVHATPDGKLAVIGVMAQEGKANSEFQKILDHAPNSVSDLNLVNITMNPAKLLPGFKNSFYLYAGSLTTPPCTEGVNWYVLKNPIELSKTQIEDFEKFYPDNARHAQDLHGRRVLNYK